MLVDALMAALLVRGAQPVATPATEGETVLRFNGCEFYFLIDTHSNYVSFNERMEIGGDVLIDDWTCEDGNIPVFAAHVVQESWPQLGLSGI